MKIVLDMDAADGADKQGFGTAMMIAEHANRVLQKVMSKNVNYEDAWVEQGWMGNLGRILSKTTRLRNMLWGDIRRQNTEETVEDTAYDLIALTIFFLANRERGNPWGRGFGG